MPAVKGRLATPRGKKPEPTRKRKKTVVRDLCLPSRASPSTSADAVAQRDLSYSWDRGGKVVSDRDNRDSPQPQLLRRGGQTKRPSAEGRDHRSPVALLPPLLPGAITPPGAATVEK